MPDRLQNVFESLKSVYISENVIFFCGGFIRLGKRAGKKVSDVSFLYSVSEDKWVFPRVVRSWGQGEGEGKADWGEHVFFVANELLRTRFGHQDHRVIIFQDQSQISLQIYHLFIYFLIRFGILV